MSDSSPGEPSAAATRSRWPSVRVPLDEAARDRHTQATIRFFVMMGGFFMLLISVFLAFGIYQYTADRDVRGFTFYQAAGVGMALCITLISLVLGTRMIVRDGSLPRVVIPTDDRELLEEMIKLGNEKAIDQYVRLSSLSGMTGTATKLGLTGLPLATVGLTIFFSAVAIFGADGFLDLAKLTLGAFIGSFVQRSVSAEQVAAEGRRRTTPLSDQ